MRWEDVTQPAGEPIALADLKAWLRIEHGEDDALLDGLLRSAREWVERYTGRSLAARQVRQWASTQEIDLALFPVSNIDAVVLHYEDGTTASLADSDWALAGERLRVLRIPAGSAALRAHEWLEVLFTTGVSDSEQLRLAVQQLVAYWYEQRLAATERLRWEYAPEAARHLVYSLRRFVLS